jgi:hypothetical protein
MIHNVLIFSNRTDKQAAQDINDALAKYQDEETDVNYELMIEASATIGNLRDTRYTVLIEVSDSDAP